MKVATALESIQPSYIREILSAASAEGVISLAGGLPAAELFPMALIEEAMALVARRSDLYQYGETQGYGPLLDHQRECLQLSPEFDALICNGSQQGLDLIARAFINPGDGVAVEAPSYLGALQVFALAGASIKTIDQHEDGPDLNALENGFKKGDIKLFYAVPDFHNPTGVCWSLPVRKQVASLCRLYGVTLIEDAPYRELRFSGEELPMVSSFCPENAIVLRSFSKISTPGIRLGVMIAPKKWLAPMLKIKQASDLHSGQPMQAMLLHLLSHADFPQHIDNIQTHYAQRYRALATAIEEQLPSAFSFSPVSGGMFVWLNIPGYDPLKVAESALKNNVAVVPGNVFYSDNVAVQPSLRLNFSHTRAEKLSVAVSKLKKTFEDLKL